MSTISRRRIGANHAGSRLTDIRELGVTDRFLLFTQRTATSDGGRFLLVTNVTVIPATLLLETS